MMTGGLRALRNVKKAVLTIIPNLEELTLRAAFKCAEEVEVKSASLFEKNEEVIRVQKKKEPAIVEVEKELVIKDEMDLKDNTPLIAEVEKQLMIKDEMDLKDNTPSVVEVIVVEDNCCKDVRELDLSVFVRLKKLKVGNHSFRKVETLNLFGLKCLESVVIGEGSFVKYAYNTSEGRDDHRRFCVKHCPSLKELKIGYQSFMDYSVIEIENVDALEVIEIGDLNRIGASFVYASLELKSVLIHKELQIDMPSLKSLTFGGRAFQRCSRIVFESDSFSFHSLNRLA